MNNGKILKKYFSEFRIKSIDYEWNNKKIASAEILSFIFIFTGTNIIHLFGFLTF